MSDASIRPTSVRLLVPGDAESLGELLESEDSWHFRPHPMTREYAEVICSHRGLDIYCGAFLEGDELVAYGILRGWDDGFKVPSLGILVARSHRGQGIGRRVMNALHSLARFREVDSVRLRVAPGNAAAMALYEAMGYVFDGTMDRGELVGTLSL